MKAHPSLTNPKASLTKYKEIWHFYKRTWYVPFIWSLTWYSYWILRDIAVWHKPLNQMNPTNCAGTIISIAFILSATQIGRGVRSAFVFVGTHIGRGIRSAFVFIGTQSRKIIVGTHIGRGIRSAFVFVGTQSRKIIVGTHITEGVQIAPISVGAQTNDIIQMEKSKQQMQRVSIRIEKPKQRIGHSQQPFSSVSVCPHNLDYFSQRPRPKQVPAECIACGNLIQCVCFTNT
jgi:hypothetical protein